MIHKVETKYLELKAEYEKMMQEFESTGNADYI
ncbi:MAG: hypothetical protein ACI93N_002370 [Flavobacteriaceae bacterium]|jgi:hypothetical protein